MCTLKDCGFFFFKDRPDIYIQGENEILCGDTARFEADVKNVESSSWSVTWRKCRGDVIKCIDTSMEKYRDSTKRKLVINSLSKEDEGEYQAFLTLESNGPDYKSRNTIHLHVIGGKLINELKRQILERRNTHINMHLKKHTIQHVHCMLMKF